MELSKIIAGVMKWGEKGKMLSEKEIQNLIRFCVENDITTFDHADIYGGYTTESLFGKVFSDSKILRSDVKFVTKCGIKAVSEYRKTAIKHYDYSQKYIETCVNNSLLNLKTDYIDVLLLHRPSPLIQTDEVAETIFALKKAGKILSFGVSNFSPSQTALLQQKIKIDFNQIQFSATHLDAMTNGSLDFMQQNQIVPMAWQPLGSVFSYEDEKSFMIMKCIQKFAQKYNVAPETILISWILKHPSGILPIFGTTNIERIANIKKATSIDLELEDWFEIWEHNRGKAVD